VCDEDQPPDAPPTAWPAVFFAFAGGGLAMAAIGLEHWAAEFAACGCLALAWYLSRQLGEAENNVHPLGRRSTQLLLMAFAAITGVAGVLRLIRGG
jgi:hypothetical protein